MFAALCFGFVWFWIVVGAISGIQQASDRRKKGLAPIKSDMDKLCDYVDRH